jgi:purine-binding chemotaxis protein CheW
VASFAANQTDAAPDIGVGWNSEYIASVIRRETGFVVIIDLARLLSSAEMATLAAVPPAPRAA